MFLNHSSTTRSAPKSGPVSLVLLAALASCQDSGGSSNTSGLLAPPVGEPLSVDFGFRQDVDLGCSSIGDVKHVDFNGDGVQDLVETNFLPMKVSLALGGGDGSFVPLTTLPTTGHAWRLALGDFDGDGMVDIAVANHEYNGTGASAVDVFLQGPTPAEFTQPAITLAYPVNPVDLTAAPLTGLANSSGPDELFVAVRDLREVSRTQLMSGALVETGTLDSSDLGVAGGPMSLAVVDLGGDGELDLVVGETRIPAQPDRIVQYARLGGSFDPAQLVLSPVFGPIVDAAGDVDSNTFDDVAVAQFNAPDVYLLGADASGLSMATSIDFGGRTTSLIFPDLDGDGFAEAIATTLTQTTIQVLPGTGPLAWGEAVNYNAGPVPRAIDTIALPGDAIPDLLCGNAKDISILAGIGQGQFRAMRGYSTEAPGPFSLELADLDNDGDLDAITISSDQRSISFLEGDGQAGFETQVVLPLIPSVMMDRPANVATADMDGDGFLDVLVSVLALDEVRLYRNPGRIADFEDPMPEDVSHVEGGPIGIDVADMNGDTLPDVIVANSTAGTVQVLLNTGGGELAIAPGSSFDSRPLGPLATDFDADGTIDVALFAEDLNGFLVQILAGDGEGGLSLASSYPIDGASVSMVTGDFDEDSRPDLAIGQLTRFDNDIYVLLNQGDLAFDSRRHSTFDGPGVLMVDDLDNDFHQDIAVATSLGEFAILFGDGTGGFPKQQPTAPGEFSIANRTLGGKLGDLDGDQLPDFVSVATSSPFLWVALNTSTPIPEE